MILIAIGDGLARPFFHQLMVDMQRLIWLQTFPALDKSKGGVYD
jgi:hypothetical protein